MAAGVVERCMCGLVLAAMVALLLLLRPASCLPLQLHRTTVDTIEVDWIEVDWIGLDWLGFCLLYTSPSPRDRG